MLVGRQLVWWCQAEVKVGKAGWAAGEVAPWRLKVAWESAAAPTTGAKENTLNVQGALANHGVSRIQIDAP